tara:strand:- start:4724 stop:5392 length:669 start_codon:yes stop_codon:yes gene_type:complete
MTKFFFVRFIKTLIIIIALYSCSNLDLSSSSSSAFNVLLNNFSETEILFDKETVDSIPYASSLISFEGGTKSLIILESKEVNKNTWVSSDRVKFIENDGRIIRSFGMPNDLYYIQRPNLDFDFLLKKESHSYITYYSFRKPVLNNLKVEVTSRLNGLETVDILGQKRQLIVLEETLYSAKINWSATNKYWIDPKTKYVWKSRQYLSPRLPYIEIEVTKKPAE